MTEQNDKQNAQKVEAKMITKATAALQKEEAEELEQEDKPLEDLISNDEAESKE